MGLLEFFFGKKKPEVKRFTIAKITELSEENKALLKQQYKSLEEDLSKQWDVIREKNRKKVEEINSKCPKCGSNKVNNGGSLYGSGRIDGKLDTNPVNKCNDCQNEWQIAKNDYSYGRKTMEDLAEMACSFLDHCYDAYHGDVKFDPNNLKENFATEEDKRKSLIEELPKYWRGRELKDFTSKYSIELVQYIVDSELGERNGSNVYYYEMWQKGDKSMLTTILGIPSIIK